MSPKMPRMETSVLELIVLMVACLAPIFFMANELSGDEFAKASTGAAIASMTAGILAGYKLWKSK